jgi:glycosyltransferase involved in cell wall biosynthesis
MLKKILVKGPAMSRSGYGEQTRFALRALRSREDLFDIYLINIPWGRTGHMAHQTEESTWMHGLLQKTAMYTAQPTPAFDISLQVTIPLEFEKIAPLNIGYTAGIETTKVSPKWIERSNDTVDKIITISQHSKTVFENTKYNVTNQNTGEEIPNWGLERPVEVVGYPTQDHETEDLDITFSTSKNFLVVSQWGPRKNLDNTIKWFVQEFKDDPDAGLVLKTNTAADCILDRSMTSNRLKSLLGECESWGVTDRKCKIHLLHGEVTPGQLKWLYTHPSMKALINIAHGEGFGLPLFEAAQNGLPLITVTWGGQLDFVCRSNKKGKAVPHVIGVDYSISPVQDSAVWEGVIEKDAMWCFARETAYKRALQEALSKEDHHRQRATLLQKTIAKNFASEVLYEQFVSYICPESADTEVLEWLKKIDEVTEL